ncbi:hypothetical protein SCALIN_C03_0042 [Candidatus Scalindua japonica]|uniref:Uncharacterized protein n=1 Tax=Candidatus Scalindua japonica TaxID=1284222 RepID=A0A286TU59_9BACT|nr:hypothetical protein SCALIN_C03_0042 [Candidatus Scalindua japonica]
MPPAAEPDAPPINIKKIKYKKVGVARLPISTIVNPAVLVVIDWKKETDILSLTENSSSELLYSNM